MRINRLAAFVALLIAAFMLVPHPGRARTDRSLDAATLSLANGQYVWAADTTGYGVVDLVVSIPMQRLFVYRGGRLIGASTVSTGRASKPTPTGDFTILEKDLYHRSNIYSDAPMPFMQRLTWSGIAMHAGHLPGYPASHGCIRMPRAFAKRLFDLTRLGAQVTVTDQPISSGFAPNRTAPEQTAPPPVLIADADDYESSRFHEVVSDGYAFAAPGETVYAPARPVIEPIARRR